jgi:hypothetical protein
MKSATLAVALILVANLSQIGYAQKGTVTSVGLSAPSSDFTVTGSPVTTSGILGLNWNVAPSSSNNANAIVKRDASGNINVGSVTAQGLGNSAIWGTSSGTNAISGYNDGSGRGVEGTSELGIGIHGQGSMGVVGITSSNCTPPACADIGVYGTTNSGGNARGFGFATDSNVQQERTAGGWVKAMAYSSGFNSGRVVSCFNSTLSLSAATAPCGFTFTKKGTGDYIIDFGFEVDDRFFSATSTSGASLRVVTATNGSVSGLPGCNSSLSTTQVEVCAYYGGTFSEEKFYLVVF